MLDVVVDVVALCTEVRHQFLNGESQQRSCASWRACENVTRLVIVRSTVFRKVRMHWFDALVATGCWSVDVSAMNMKEPHVIGCSLLYQANSETRFSGCVDLRHMGNKSSLMTLGRTGKTVNHAPDK